MVPALSDFIYTGWASRVVFGAGSLRFLPREIELLGARKALVVCTAEQSAQAQRVAESIGSRAAGVFAQAVMHVPIETALEARETARRLDADCVVTIGGGSTTGLGKAIALESELPILAIPTTYAGSEMTPIYGITERGLKRTGKDARVLPRTVIYDPELTLSLPIGLSVTSGMNAIAHAAEGLYSQDRNPITDLMAEEGISAIAGALPHLTDHPLDVEMRSRMLYGAWLCGTVLGAVGMALHHKLCHVVGGSFNLPHAETHTIVLPHALAYNAPAIPLALERMSRALRSSDPIGALYDLARTTGAPCALRDIGMRETDLARACDLAVANPYWNPRTIEREGIRGLLQHAWEGSRPA